MTASKSSRARAARAAARASAAKDAASGGTAVKNGTAVKDRDRTQARSARAPSAQARAGQARTVAAGRGPRTPLVEDDPGDRGPAPWMQLTTFVLALGGLGVSIYLTIAHFTESALAGCSESGLVNCTKVTTSPQSYVFGIPVAVLGLAFFVFVAAIMSPWAWQARRREVHMLRLASMVVGIGMVIYLVYAEFIIIGSICLYCTSVHIITFLLFVLTAFGAAVWGLKPGAPWGIFRRRQATPEAASA
ncbi:MAG TPA: vitamin K epoxide reductase family protein [Streptosporangiaceae bacterium]|nr:vitamin K epoxide reductase family protein [Streptosporangiaceae bacterium]